MDIGLVTVFLVFFTFYLLNLLYFYYLTIYFNNRNSFDTSAYYTNGVTLYNHHFFCFLIQNLLFI